MMSDEGMPSADRSHDGDVPEGILLDSAEVRVLAVLAEKEALTPDNYPLSLNALTNGCNQLSSRDPVMNLSEDEIRQTLDRLIDKKLAAEVRQAGARVVKYEHRMRIQWTLEQDKLAALAVLMLRGAQTAAEIRSRADRLYEFSSTLQAESALQFLIDKYPPLAVRLPRAAGTKEARYAHTFSGTQLANAEDSPSSTRGRIAGAPDRDRIAALESEIELLRSELQKLNEEFLQFKKGFE